MDDQNQNKSSNISTKVSIEIKCNIEGEFSKIDLIFSTDNGHSWYSIKMEKNESIYSTIIPEIPTGMKILYLFKAIGMNEEEYIEDNNGMYYYEIAGQDSDISPSKLNSDPSENNILGIEKGLEIIESENSFDLNIKEFDPTKTIRLQNSESFDIVKNSYIKNNSNDIKDLDHNSKSTQLENKKKTDNSELKDRIIRPIVPYNPFSADYGDLENTNYALNSFSQIIDERLTSLPQKKGSFKNHPQLDNLKRCNKCKANLNPKWRICPICGIKV